MEEEESPNYEWPTIIATTNMNGLLSTRNGPSPSSGHNSVCKKAKLYADHQST